MQKMTFGQAEILTNRLNGIVGNDYARTSLKLKRLDSLQDDIKNGFDILNDDIAYQFWINIIDYIVEV